MPRLQVGEDHRQLLEGMAGRTELSGVTGGQQVEVQPVDLMELLRAPE